MNLDTLGRLHSEEARNTVTEAQIPPVEQIMGVRRSDRMVAALGWVAAAAMAVVAAVLVASPAPDLTPATLAPAVGNSTTTTGVSTSTTMIPPLGAWNPILATTRAKPAPPASTCPPGADPDHPGPADQERPRAEYNWNLKAVFDQHAGRIFYLDTAGETWAFDVCANNWQNMNPGGVPTGAGGFDAAGNPDGGIIALVYDADSDVTVAFGYERISVYDANTNTWTQPTNNVVGIGDGPMTPYGVAYDPVSGLIITSTYTSEESWAYDVDTNEWTLLGPVRRETRGDDRFDFLGYSEQLDQLIFTGSVITRPWVESEVETILVDPRTGDVTELLIESPVINFGLPGGTYGAAGGTVYAATMYMATPNDICGFDANVKAWTACFDAPNDAASATDADLVGDPINNRLVLMNVGPRAGVAANGVGAIELDTGEWTQLLTPAPISYPSTYPSTP